MPPWLDSDDEGFIVASLCLHRRLPAPVANGVMKFWWAEGGLEGLGWDEPGLGRELIHCLVVWNMVFIFHVICGIVMVNDV